MPIDCCEKMEGSLDTENDETVATACFPIEIQSTDPNFKKETSCMNFARSISSIDIDCKPGIAI